ncbi:MAG: hypothetical protein COA78_28690 [Blastopirellula sp.]|nr:MAG: hypothetical protein COA78_28690 [Blastopirellula sp.]
MVAPYSLNENVFKKTLQYQSNATVKSVLNDFEYFQQFDKEQEKKCLTWGMICGAGVVLAVAGILLCFNEQTSFGIPVIVVGAVVAIAAGINYQINKRLDLENKRYELASGVLQLLKTDMAEDSTINVALDFNPHNHKAKFVRSGKVGYWNAKFYLDKWLEIQGRFVDGTKFSLTFIEKQQDRHRTKRSASGKTKHKYKTKNASEVIVSLKIKNKRYPHLESLINDLNKSVQLPPWVELKSVVTDGDALTIRSVTKNSWGSKDKDGVNWVALKFLSLYKLLNDAKVK